MQSEFFDNLFIENHSIDEMATITDLSALSENEIAELSGFFKEALTPPGHMPIDQAKKYMAQIVTLFAQDEVRVMLAIAGWAALHDIGSVQDFSTKPPIVCGSVSKAATEVFGGIVPVSADGEPRQFCAAMFEVHIGTVLKVFPQLKSMLATRSAEAGLASSDPKSVISYVRGVTAVTASGAVARSGAKSTLLRRNASSVSGGGASTVARNTAAAAVEEVVPSSGHSGLW